MTSSAADLITSGRGADVITSGDDTGFVYAFITDPEIGIGTLALSGFGVASAGDLAFATLPAGNTTLQLSPSRFIVFEGQNDTTAIAPGASGSVFVQVPTAGVRG